MYKKRKIGLALSGGAIYGIAHLGVIKILEENNIPIDLIAGTSAGSLVGAFLAAGYTSDQLFDIAQNLSWSKVSKPTIPKMGILDGKFMEKYIDSYIGRIEFAELKKPFAAIAVDLNSGKEKILNNGIVSEAVRASCAIPGIFTPVIKNNEVLVDGGVLNFIPTNVVREMGADYVIAVKLTPSITHSSHPENIMHIIFNSFQLTLAQIANNAPDGDATIIPDLEGLNMHDFNQRDQLYHRGRTAGLELIEKIKSDIASFGILSDVIKNVKKKILT